ncbi:MAG: hypothetical protein M3N54_13255 [Acidobacteriota bacterium]|nr:hypothetical protein [Acidobacteriota bacterium]
MSAWIVPVDGREKPYTIAKTRFEERAGAFSPDATWVAYSSNESLRYEIYLTPFPAGDGKRYTVSNQGRESPAWRRDGREICFVAGEGRLRAVPVTIRVRMCSSAAPRAYSLSTRPPSAAPMNPRGTAYAS